MSGGWWPIECAPDDGTVVDLWLVDEAGVGMRLTDCFWNENQWHKKNDYWDELEGMRITHWRSVPSGPRRARRAHVTEGEKCWCGPQVERHGEAFVMIHNDSAYV